MSRQQTCIQQPATCFMGSSQAMPQKAQRKSSEPRPDFFFGSAHTAQ